jgi:hypothetical protein
VNYIKTDLVEIRWDVVDWIGMAQDRKQWNLRVPENTGKL